jgi:hypothetical protein
MQAGIFAMAQALGMQLLDNTAQRLRAAPVPAATLQLARRLFGPATPPDQIAGHLDTIRTTLAAQTTGNTILGTPCHKSCQGGVVAFVRADAMTICPAFFETADPFQQARVLVHESAHKQSGLDVRDRAYGWERLINLLGRVAPAQALNNADSFTLLVMFDNGLTGLPSSQAPTDDLSALPAADRDKAEVALAYLQRWLTATQSIANWLYNNINDGIGAGSWTNARARTEMQFVAGQFGLDFLAARPRDRDRAAVAAIYDRYRIMARSLTASLVVTASSGNTHWQPGPGNAVAVAPSLWGRNTPDQVRLLLNRLAAATPDIRAGLVPAYVAVADRFRQFRSEGP